MPIWRVKPLSCLELHHSTHAIDVIFERVTTTLRVGTQRGRIPPESLPCPEKEQTTTSEITRISRPAWNMYARKNWPIRHTATGCRASISIHALEGQSGHDVKITHFSTTETDLSPMDLPRALAARPTVELRPRNPDIASKNIAHNLEATLISSWEQLVKDHYRIIKYRPGIGYNHYRHGTPTSHEWRCVGKEYPSVGYNQGPRALHTHYFGCPRLESDR